MTRERPVRQLGPAVSLAGRLALRGLRPELAASAGGDYNGVLFTLPLDGRLYGILWHLADGDPLYWAFRILDGAGNTAFQSLLPLRTREGPSPLTPTHPDVPVLHVSTPPEEVAAVAANLDYTAILHATQDLVAGNTTTPEAGRRQADTSPGI